MYGFLIRRSWVRDMDGESRVRLGRVDMGADEAGSNPADFDENGSVELADFGSLAAAYLSDPCTVNWNPICDMSVPPDEVIDAFDLTIYSSHWLWRAPWHVP